jgi:competence protein ComEA
MNCLTKALSTVIIATIVAAAAGAVAGEAQAANNVVNINTATVAELSLLPGVGPSKATAIVKYRKAHPFKKVEDILRVKGIGRKSFKAMRSHLTVNGPTTAKKKIKLAK